MVDSLRIGDFFFQAEDGIRDLTVTGVQTCALPISRMIITSHIVGLLVGLTFVAIGLLIVVRAPGDSGAVIFYTLALLTAVALIGRAATSYESTGARGIVIDPFSAFFSVSIVGILTMMYMPMILHLALVFPRRRPIVQGRPYVIRW